LGGDNVSVNGIFLPANFAIQHARRCCVPLHASTGMSSWPVRNLGSGVLYAYRGRQYCVFTRHQLQGEIKPWQIHLRLDPGSHALHGGVRYFEFPHPHPLIEEHDLCLLEMPWTLNHRPEGPMFIQATPPTSLGDDDAEHYFAVGYPSKLTQMDASEEDGHNRHIGLTQVRVQASSLTVSPNDLPTLTLMTGEVMLPRCSGNFDGFSGGPVFGVNRQTASLTLRGIVVRGGIDKVSFVPTDWVQKLCDLALEADEVEWEAA
jgi:hypothetical protein